MSYDEFLHQRKFSFWKQFHLIEKIMKENSKMINALNIEEKINHQTSAHVKIKKFNISIGEKNNYED